jgi:hypothetical protein
LLTRQSVADPVRHSGAWWFCSSTITGDGMNENRKNENLRFRWDRLTFW